MAVTLIESENRKNMSVRLWVAAGLVLTAIHLIAVITLRELFEKADIGNRLAIIPSMMLILAAVVYLLVVWQLCRGAATKRILIWICLVAAIMRLAIMFSPPIADADYWRYLWDGSVTAAGINPYRYSPQQAIENTTERAEIKRLAIEGKNVLPRITHPHLRTIYPPFAQALFALAHWLTPFQILGWRLLLFVFDVFCAIVIMSMLQRAGLPLVYIVVYLWNPLLINETYYGGHIDLVAGMLVLLFAWYRVNGSLILASIVLACAVGVKLWPALLVFFLIFAPESNRRVRFTALALFIVTTALIGVLYSTAAFGSQSGTTTYLATWLANAGAFKLLMQVSRMTDGWPLDRLLLAVGLLAVALYQAWTSNRHCRSLCDAMGMVILLMLLLSPALYPWYYVALIPLAAVSVRPEFLIWTMLLPLVYLLPESVASYVIHLPVWALLVARLTRHYWTRHACLSV